MKGRDWITTSVRGADRALLLMALVASPLLGQAKNEFPKLTPQLMDKLNASLDKALGLLVSKLSYDS
jgi:hypothetical protein